MELILSKRETTNVKGPSEANWKSSNLCVFITECINTHLQNKAGIQTELVVSYLKESNLHIFEYLHDSLVLYFNILVLYIESVLSALPIFYTLLFLIFFLILEYTHTHSALFLLGLNVVVTEIQNKKMFKGTQIKWQPTVLKWSTCRELHQNCTF